MTWFTFSAADPLCRCLSISITVWLTLLLVFFLAPAVLGVSLGLHRLYVATLLNVFEVRPLSVAESKLFCGVPSPSHSFFFKSVGDLTDENDSQGEESAAVQAMEQW